MRNIKLALLFIAKNIGLFGLARHLTRNKLRILCYHGGSILDEEQFNPKLFFPPHKLETRMLWLRQKGFTVLGLDDVLQTDLSRNENKNLLPTVITFDDGWYSTTSQLIPVLNRFGLKSTMYLSTKNFLDASPIVAVSVRYITWKTKKVLTVISGLANDLDGTYDLRHPKTRELLNVKAAKWITDSCLDRPGVCQALEKYANALEVPKSELHLETRRFDYLSKDELKRIESQGCKVELHGHIHLYPVGNTSAFESDLRKCKAVIEHCGSPTPRHYCYPSGNHDVHAAPVLKKLDIVSATTCRPGLISTIKTENRFFLPRFLDGGDVSDLEFESELSGFTDVCRRLVRILLRN